MDSHTHQANGKYEDEINLHEVWGLVRRQIWLILFCLVTVVGATIAYTFTRVPVFEAQTLLRIDEDRSNLPVLDILKTISQASKVETEMAVLRSRTLAEEVVDSLDLQLTVLEPKGLARVAALTGIHVERWAPSGIYRLTRLITDDFSVTDEESGELMGRVSTERPAALPGATFRLVPEASEFSSIVVRVATFPGAVSGLESALTVMRPNREAGIVTVRYESPDTQLVYQVPNRLVEAFILQRQDIQRTEASSTAAFLVEQIDTLAIRLAAAEESLVTFREEGQVVSLAAEGAAQVTQLARMQAERNQMDAEREALQELLDGITAEAVTVGPDEDSPYRMLIAFPPLYANGATSELLRSLNDVDSQRSLLMLRRTREDPDVRNLTQRIRELETQLQSIATTYLQGLTNQVGSLDRTLEQFGAQLEVIPGKEIQLARLEREEAILAELFTLLQTRLQEVQIAEAVEDGSVRIVDPGLPNGPISPRVVLNMGLGVILGLLLAMGLAFLREHMDDTVHTKEQVQQAAGGVPVLGMIPRIQVRRVRNGRRPSELQENGTGHLGDRLVTGRDPRSPVSEAYRSLRTNITFSNPDRPPKTIVFTSPLPQDGKSTSSANLAITLVQQGARVLLLDADLRRGVLQKAFDVPSVPGLSEVLSGQAVTSEAVQQISVGEDQVLEFLPTGTLPPNPAELLGSRRMEVLLRELEGRYDNILLDAPPLTVVTDAALLGTKADGVILIARAAMTNEGALRYAVDQLENVRAKIIGVILNDLDFKRDGRANSVYGPYAHYYKQYYGQKG